MSVADAPLSRKAVVLLSGGLDSTLAARLMLEQGIALHGLYFSMLWGCCDRTQALASADALGIPLLVYKVQEDYLQIVRQPKYGYGTQLNPCVDCRIYMFSIARRYMEELGASFVVTGEVFGQRPMSQQRRSLAIIEAEAGLEGRLLRPLSARLLEPTLPELLGVVDRARLLAVQGRSRREQIALAATRGITDYAQPAGGCLLTNAEFATKVKDLLAHEEQPGAWDMELLTIGRHFRLGPATKAVLGRNETENGLLEVYHRPGKTTLVAPQFAGPSALVVGPFTPEARQLTLVLIGRYTKLEKVSGDPLGFRCNEETLWVARRDMSRSAAPPPVTAAVTGDHPAMAVEA